MVVGCPSSYSIPDAPPPPDICSSLSRSSLSVALTDFAFAGCCCPDSCLVDESDVEGFSDDCLLDSFDFSSRIRLSTQYYMEVLRSIQTLLGVRTV